MFIYIRPLLLALSLMGGVYTLLIPNALASDGLRLSEDKLIFQGSVSKPLQRTFTVIAPDDEIPAVEVVRHDLLDPDTKAVLLGTNIKVEPEPAQKGLQRFAVTITSAEAGQFNGNLDLRLKRKTGEENRTMPINVETVSPNVDSDSNSKTLSLAIQPGWGIWPWGTPTVNQASPKLGEITLTLLQNGEGKASIEKASILTMRGAKGNILPNGSVTVETPLPLDLQHHEGKPLKVVVKGSNLPADEYNGLLYVSVKKQTNAVQVPLRLQVKDGPLLALLFLIIGPLVGILIHWWNTKGLARYKIYQSITRLENQLAATSGVQMDIKQALDNAKAQLVAGQEPAEIDKLLGPLSAMITAAGTDSKKFLQDKLEPLRSRIKEMKPGEAYRNKLLTDVGQIEDMLSKGQFANLAEAQKKLDDVGANVEAWAGIIADYVKLPDTDGKIAAAMDRAATLELMRAALQAPAAARGISRGPVVEERQMVFPATPTWASVTLGLKLGRIVMAIFLYLFTLTVGYITLYAKAPTFGADLENYLTLFLWGVSVNIVGAQAIDLKAIYSKGS